MRSRAPNVLGVDAPGRRARREPPENFMRALQRRPDDIKVVIQFAQA